MTQRVFFQVREAGPFDRGVFAVLPERGNESAMIAVFETNEAAHVFQDEMNRVFSAPQCSCGAQPVSG